MTRLVDPDPERVGELAEMLAEFAAAGGRPPGSGWWKVPETHWDPVVASSLRAWVHLLDRLGDPEATYLDDTVPSDSWWITDGGADGGADGGELVGFLALRHRLNAWLLAEGGHIGYSIRPSRRRQGHAAAALREAVDGPVVRLGLSRVLITCDLDNLGSARTIERCGGVLEDERAGKRRYWITVS